MSVDNCGIFLIGFKKNSEVDYRLAFLSDKEHQEAIKDDINDYVCYNKGSNAPSLELDWTFGEPKGCESSGAIGFYLESPSYDMASFELEQFATDVVKISQAWQEYAIDTPRVFVLNLQF